MIELDKLDWGWMDIPSDKTVTDIVTGEIIEEGQYHKNMMIAEIFKRKQYEEVFTVKEGDTVVDIGASIGPFTYSILSKNPFHVYCLEPSEDEFVSLSKNLPYLNVTLINKGISNTNTRHTVNTVFQENEDNKMQGITLDAFVKEYDIAYIDFLKTDCEGGEYKLFTDENMEFLLNRVSHIVGEWHLGSDLDKIEFRYFRDKYLKQFKTVEARSIDGVDITWNLWNDDFISFYNQVILHISN